MIHQLDWDKPYHLFTDCALSPAVMQLPTHMQAIVFGMVDEHELRLLKTMEQLKAQNPKINGMILAARYPGLENLVFSSTFQFNGKWEDGAQLVRHLLNIGAAWEMQYAYQDEDGNTLTADVEFKVISPT